MANEIVEGTKPTRMELLNIKKKKSLAKKGHKLLTEKRDALVAEFLGIIKTREQHRNELNELLKKGFDSLIRAEMESGFDELVSIATSAPEAPEVPVTGVNIMGVTVPRIESSGLPDRLPPFYSLRTTSSRLDTTVDLFRLILKKILIVAEIEGTIERLALEIEKTRRRVNALEYIFVPRLENTEKYIEMQLQEREREDFFKTETYESGHGVSSTDERRTIYRKTTKGILYNFGGKNIGFILTFIFTIVIARELGPSDYGSYSFYRNTAAFLALFTILGLDQTMNHFVPSLKQAGREETVRPLVRRGILMSVTGVVCVSFLSIVAFLILPRYSDWGYEFSPDVLLLFIGLIIAITFSAVMRGVISGMFHQRFLNIVETGSVASKLLLTLLFFWVGLDVEGVLLAVVIAFAFPSILDYHHVMKELAKGGRIENDRNVGDRGNMGSDISEGGQVKRKENNEGKGVTDDGSIERTWGEMRKYALIMMIFTASYIMLDNQIDIILLKFISSDSEAGYYNIAFRFAFINALVFIGAIDGVLVPTFTSLKGEDQLHQKQALHGSLKYTLFFLIPIALAGMMFSDQLVDVFFGDEYEDSVMMLRILYGTLVISMAISWPIRYLLISIGHERKIMWFYIGYAILNVAGDLILIPMYDGIGAVMATGCTTWLVALHLIYYTRKLGLMEFPLRFTIISAASALIAGIPFYLFLDHITNLGWLVGAYLIFCGLYLVLHYLMKGITREELALIWGMVRERGT